MEQNPPLPFYVESNRYFVDTGAFRGQEEPWSRNLILRISEFIAACAKMLLSGVRKTNRAKQDRPAAELLLESLPVGIQ
jgi:hypothetical protein